MPVREKKAVPDRSKKDDEKPDFIEINPYGDMICTFIFLAEIAALLRHAKVSLVIFYYTIMRKQISARAD